jgi:hypothetical protein
MLKKSFIIKRLSSVFIAASMLSALTSCAYFGEHESTPGAEAAESAKPDAERETGKRLLTAFSAGDYKSFARNFPRMSLQNSMRRSSTGHGMNFSRQSGKSKDSSFSRNSGLRS